MNARKTAAKKTGRPPAGKAKNAAGSQKLWGRMAWGVFLLPAAAVLLPTTLILGVTMLPTLAAYVVDRTQGKALTITVGLLNFTGSLPAVLALWDVGHRIGGVSRVLGEPLFWMGAYMAAGVGWTIYLALPAMLKRYYTNTTDARMRKLEDRQAALREEWGQEVSGESAKGAATAAEKG